MQQTEYWYIWLPDIEQTFGQWAQGGGVWGVAECGDFIVVTSQSSGSPVLLFKEVSSCLRRVFICGLSVMISSQYYYTTKTCSIEKTWNSHFLQHVTFDL